MKIAKHLFHAGNAAVKRHTRTDHEQRPPRRTTECGLKLLTLRVVKRVPTGILVRHLVRSWLRLPEHWGRGHRHIVVSPLPPYKALRHRNRQRPSDRDR